MDKKTVKKKLVLKKSVRGFLTRLMLTVIIVLIGLIFVKSNSNIKKIITKNVYERSFNFGVAKNIYQKYFGSIFPINKVIQEDSIYVTVEDNNGKMENIKEKLENVKEIKLVTQNEDNTKKYIITGEKDVDLRKNIFDTFAKEGITIFEMKKADATLEDAFIKLIETAKDEEGGKE